MRRINQIVVHCSATSQDAKIESIKKFWRETLGWKSVGYHYIIEKDGKVTKLADDAQVTNGVAGHNKNSIHLCYIGGEGGVDNRTYEQKEAIANLLIFLVKKYPDAKILGHNNFPNVAKTCPNFDAEEEYQFI